MYGKQRKSHFFTRLRAWKEAGMQRERVVRLNEETCRMKRSDVSPTSALPAILHGGTRVTSPLHVFALPQTHTRVGSHSNAVFIAAACTVRINGHDVARTVRSSERRGVAESPSRSSRSPKRSPHLSLHLSQPPTLQNTSIHAPHSTRASK